MASATGQPRLGGRLERQPVSSSVAATVHLQAVSPVARSLRRGPRAERLAVRALGLPALSAALAIVPAAQL